MEKQFPTGICKPLGGGLHRINQYIDTSEEVIVEGVVMVIFPTGNREMFPYYHHLKEMNHGRKPHRYM